jgi:hypothetical protein
MRIRTAHFPAVKTIEDFNLDHLPSHPRRPFNFLELAVD